MEPTIQLSAAASEYIKGKLAKEASLGFRLSIKKTGCSGFSYAPSLVKAVNPKDVLLNAEGINFYIDSAWIDLLQDIQIDYVIDEKSGIKQKQLVFQNPKESSRCGCGISFHVESV